MHVGQTLVMARVTQGFALFLQALAAYAYGSLTFTRLPWNKSGVAKSHWQSEKAIPAPNPPDTNTGQGAPEHFLI